MQISEVNSPALVKLFLKVPQKIHAQILNSQWIRPLDRDVEMIFNPTQNPCFQFGECTRWVMQDDRGEPVGRIAAFYDHRITRKGNKQPTGGIGFFECVHNYDYARLLFDTAVNWLKTKGMQAADASINFGDRSRWWGVLVRGFELEPTYCSNYNPPYYASLFEQYGFQLYFKQYTYQRFVHEAGLAEKFYEKAQRLLKDKKYKFKHIEIANLPKYAQDFRTIYNASWVKHLGVSEMTEAEAQAQVRRLKPIMDERLIWFAYYDDTPIAFFVMIPELNQIVKRLNGKLDWLGKLKFFYYRKTFKNTKALGLIIGVLPRFQGRGVESAMIAEFSKIAFQSDFPYLELQFNWVGDFLPAMIRVYEALGAKVCKVHHTYRYLFDREAPFERMPILK
ncbi:MAG: hypothetical protein NZ551_08000 [Microscillaceae bacterium]|nr:hypothetical protein [Microscillaceae bacterium]MDW8461139.1 hypothetical protein [Cytophagales bacterium]